MTAAFTGGLTVNRQNISSSPIAYEAIEEVFGLGGLGTTKPLIDVSSHDSDAREYISGLGDGSELSIECNRVHTAGNNQDSVITDVEAGANVNMQIILTDESVSPNLTKTYTFAVTPIGWVVTPSYDDKHTLTLTMKISGAITIT